MKLVIVVVIKCRQRENGLLEKKKKKSVNELTRVNVRFKWNSG